MTSQITDNVVFLQFKRFLKENAEKETHKVNKREAKEEDFEKEMQELFVQFLKEKYPVMRSSPHQMVAMMTSPDPEQTLNLHTNINPPDPSDDPCAENEEGSDEREDTDSNETQRRKREVDGGADECENCVAKDNLALTFDKWGPVFEITFDMKIIKVPDDWHNLYHWTTGRDSTRYPAIFIMSNFGDISGTFLELNLSPDHHWFKLNLNQWYNLKLKKGIEQFEFRLDDKLLWNVSNRQTQLHNWKLYKSNPWYKSG